MRWRPVLAGVIGAVLLGVALATAVAPGRVLAALGDLRSAVQSGAIPMILALAVATYGVWTVLTRKWWSGTARELDGAEGEAAHHPTKATTTYSHRTGPIGTRSPDPPADGASATTDLRQLESGQGDSPTLQSVPPAAFEALRNAPPERAVDTGAQIAGRDLEQAVHDAATDGRGRGSRGLQPYEAVAVRDRLREAVERLERARGQAGPQVTTRLETGSWTDDPIAAAFLSEDEAVAPPLRERVRAWLTPHATLERAVERSVAAIETAYGGDRE